MRTGANGLRGGEKDIQGWDLEVFWLTLKIFEKLLLPHLRSSRRGREDIHLTDQHIAVLRVHKGAGRGGTGDL